jgi:transglutaminase-like putative cysteine protease
MQAPLEAAPHRPNGWMQGISAAVTVAMVVLSLQPMAAAAKPAMRLAAARAQRLAHGAVPSGPAAPVPFLSPLASPGAGANRCEVDALKRPAPTAEEQYGQRLVAVAERAKLARPVARGARPGAEDVKALRKQLAEAVKSGAAVESSFQAAERELKAQKLPPVVLERHRAAVKLARARQAQLQQLSTRLARADDANQPAERAVAVEQVATFFEQNPQGRTHQRARLDKLPFRAPDATVREPATTPEAFPASLVGTEDAGRRAADARGRSTGANAQASLAVPVPPEALAATEDVQLTQPIRDLAASLHDNPVEIYNWVRNNIQWVPSYGSLQGSDLTLLNRRGNAFDTSSLLIALYRAAGIPARYVYGTIEVPANQVMNWVGGVTRPDAAQQLMGQGGIPSVALAQGGAIRSIRMEHVWVEALVDFVPSRGAINKEPDSWVAMDASFKQYTFTAPVDLKAAVPVGVDAAAAQIMATATEDLQTGSFTGLDQAAYDAWTQKMRADIEFQFGTQRKVSEFTGERVIIPETGSVLAGALPNKVVARTNSFTRLPDSLRHRVELTLYASAFDRAVGESSLTWTVDLPSLAGKRLGVTYAPATAADAAVLASYRSSPGDSLPLYQIHVRPVVQLDGVDQAQGPASPMGTEQTWEARFLSPGDPGSGPEEFEVAAGEEMVFGINGQGVTQEMIHRRFAQGPSNTAAENLHTVALYYWAQYDALNEVVASTRNALVMRMPSIGLFSVPLQVGYFFGIPRTGSYVSRQMDVARSLLAVVDRANGNTAEVVRLTGTYGSLLEGRTFDSLFKREQGSGVSAVQLLKEANQQRIPIYRITSENYEDIAPRLNLPADIEGEIYDAVLAGKHVMVSERAPAHGNWKGVGYIIEDPDSGAAAYLINGGLNGGSDDPCDPDRKREPVRVPIFEIILIAIIIIAIILLIASLPALAPAAGAAAKPALAAFLLLLGLGATPAFAGPSPSFPGNGMTPPGDCTYAQHLALQAVVDTECHGAPSCRPYPVRGADCVALQAAKDRNLRCALARSAVNTTCFRGGNTTHYNEEVIAYERVTVCECRLATNGCPL